MFILALAALLGGWHTIKEEAIDPLFALYEHRQPTWDEQALEKLRPGMEFSGFEGALHVHPKAVLNPDVSVQSYSQAVSTRDELFILDTVYIEAFVDQHGQVLAYTITARKRAAPNVTIETSRIKLGVTPITEAPFFGVADVASVCGAHIWAYYEISTTNNAMLNRTIAVGTTDAGALPVDFTAPDCPQNWVDALPVDEEASATASQDRFTIDFHMATPDVLDQKVNDRSSLPINSVTVTAPATTLVPNMVSLHPDIMQNLDPDFGNYD